MNLLSYFLLGFVVPVAAFAVVKWRYESEARKALPDHLKASLWFSPLNFYWPYHMPPNPHNSNMAAPYKEYERFGLYDLYYKYMTYWILFAFIWFSVCFPVFIWLLE